MISVHKTSILKEKPTSEYLCIYNTTLRIPAVVTIRTDSEMLHWRWSIGRLPTGMVELMFRRELPTYYSGATSGEPVFFSETYSGLLLEMHKANVHSKSRQVWFDTYWKSVDGGLAPNIAARIAEEKHDAYIMDMMSESSVAHGLRVVEAGMAAMAKELENG